MILCDVNRFGCIKKTLDFDSIWDKEREDLLKHKHNIFRRSRGEAIAMINLHVIRSSSLTQSWITFWSGTHLFSYWILHGWFLNKNNLLPLKADEYIRMFWKYSLKASRHLKCLLFIIKTIGIWENQKDTEWFLMR